MNWNSLLDSDRVRPTTSRGDHRIQFERDYDRSVFSTPVKRLQDKAQVFPLEIHDAIRTRLTHSLEVSSVARGLGRAVTQWLIDQERIDVEDGRAIEAIAATCGLIHDLGNPPFGHAGEDAIRSWFQKLDREGKLAELLGGRDKVKGQLGQDFLRFEGNAQTLRIVTRLQILADVNGLNLTYGTLSAACKYVAPSHLAGNRDNVANKKPGYFASENKLIEVIRDRTGTGAARNPISYLVEAADDIVYSAADIEDGIKKGVILWRDLEETLKESDDKRVLKSLEVKDTILAAGARDNPGCLPGDIHASAFRTAAIGVMVGGAVEAFQSKYDEIMSGTYRGELLKDSSAWLLLESLKDIAKKQIFCAPQVLKLELLGRKIINDLLDFFWEGASDLPLKGEPSTREFCGKVGALLSENYRRAFQYSADRDDDLPVGYKRLQLVTDYVCGMTDSFARRLHAELTNGCG